MSRLLADLDPRVRDAVLEMLGRLTEARIAVVIVDTLRTPEEQAANIKQGVSWTTNSKHLPQPPSGKSLAIDIAPYDEYRLHGADKLEWDANDPIWQKIGEIGESCGLVWGGRWKQRDLGHFEYKPPPKIA